MYKAMGYMAIRFSRNTKDSLRLHTERTDNKIEVGQGNGIRHEFHEWGACLLTHPTWLLSRYETYEAADRAMRMTLDRLAKKRWEKVRVSARPVLTDRRRSRSNHNQGPERRRRELCSKVVAEGVR